MRKLFVVVLVGVFALGISGGSPASAITRPFGATGHHRDFLVWSRFDSSETDTARLVIATRRGGPITSITHPPAGAQDIDPRVSPDGRRVLFERDLPDTAQAWVVGIDGRGERQVDLGCIDPCAGTNTPSWTPDGRHLLYDRVSGPFDDEGNAASAALWESDLHGRHNVRFSQAALDPSIEETDASFAPAGYLIVLRGRPDGHSALYRLHSDATHPQRLTAWSLNADLPDVSPARRGPSRDMIVFETRGRVATVPTTCESVANCTSKIRYRAQSRLPVQDFNPAWSPNGQRIVYVRFSPGTDASPPRGDIWNMRWNGTHKRPFSQDARFEFRPDWGRVLR